MSFAQWLAIATAILGLLGLSGWLFAIPSLTSLVPASVQMKANTAVANILAALSLYLQGGRAGTGPQRGARLLAWAAILFGAATLCEYLFGLNLRIDELLFTDAPAAFNAFRGRMSPFSATAFVLLGSALAALHRPGLRWLVRVGTIGAAALGAASFLAYSLNVTELTTDQVLPPVALNTSIAFLLLSAGLLSAPGMKLPRTTWDVARRGEVESKLLFAFIGGLSLPYLAAGITYRVSLSFARSAQWVAHAQQARVELALLHGSISDAGSAQRDYLAHAESEHQIEFDQLQSQAEGEVNALRTLLNGDAAQLGRLHTLSTAITAHMRALA